MVKIFYSPHFDRTVTISISLRDVDFIFCNAWEDVSFYDFPKIEWEIKYKKHLADKKWFTKEMSDFITQNIQPC